MSGVLTTEYSVSGMTCSHCENAVKQEVSALETVVDVQVDIATGRVAVTSATPLDDTRVREAIEEAGYELAGRL
ncbi:heavy-metal-associated domain-containing protein [Streptomyces sp. NPDC047043]|uniref:heavy-metal-associated domain-containing protein n=1 Tax=Streptomyces sp. NPDC047043 TaxID=3154497 RepID=UPI0033EB1B4C